MGDFIQVKISRAAGSSAKPEHRNFVIGINVASITADLAQGENSLVRKHVGASLAYIQNHLPEVQKVLAGQIAFSHSGELHSFQARRPPAELHFSFPASAPRLTTPDAHVGDFPLWYMPD
jgi:hypothetical protein